MCPRGGGRNFGKARVLRKNKWRIVGPAAAVTVVTGAALYFHAVYDAATAPAPSASAVASALALLGSSSADLALPAAPGSDPRAAKDVLKKTTLAGAIAFAKPFMSDTADRLDEGSALLTLWCSQHLTWAALNALPETTAAEFQKDPDDERGKRMCVSGTIVEIRAERTLAQRMLDDHAQPLIAATDQTQLTTTATTLDPSLIDAGVAGDAGPTIMLPLGSTPDDWKIPSAGKVFFAIVTTAKQPKPALPSGDQTVASPILIPTSTQPNTPPPLIAEAIAVKSSGDLVNGSSARVCGVLTGMNRHTNPTDSTTVDTHRLVGMFDLPQNHAAANTPPPKDKSAPKG